MRFVRFGAKPAAHHLHVALRHEAQQQEADDEQRDPGDDEEARVAQRELDPHRQPRRAAAPQTESWDSASATPLMR